VVLLLQHHRGHRAIRLLVALGLAACGAPFAPSERRAAITNGTPDSGDPAVVAIERGGALGCTATLIATRVLLTAAHCLPDASARIYFGPKPDAGATQLGLLDVRRHPGFDASTLDNDVALALLDGDAPAAPVTLAAAAPTVGLALRLVGFGRTSAADSTPPEKRSGTTAVTAVSATELDFVPAPSQTCEGDSGGPAFATVGGGEVLVGVTSSGDPACAQMARDLRVDAYAAGFIAPYVAATAAGAAQAGARCWYDANCAAGPCVAALDDPSLSFCAPPCSGGACPNGLSCRADAGGTMRCLHDPPSPGARGSACATDEDCASAVCAARAGASMRACTQECVPNLPGFCAAGQECAASDTTGRSACFQTAHGCAIGGAPGGVPLICLLLLVALGRRAISARTAD